MTYENNYTKHGFSQLRMKAGKSPRRARAHSRPATQRAETSSSQPADKSALNTSTPQHRIVVALFLLAS
ncbi:hypothetical protein FQN51_003595, partial [Onygenales sp. PD_10]